jgi:transaldolase
MAAGEMGCHSATISHMVIEQLAKLPYEESKQPGKGVPKQMDYYKNSGPTPERLKKLANVDPLAAADWDGKLASTDVDYLANNGKALEEAIAKDPITVQRLDDALKLFQGAIKESQQKIEAIMAKV